MAGEKPTREVINWETLVSEAEGIHYPNFEHDAYEFSTRTFREDDRAGVYNNNPN
jgi:hypothetical protein